MQNQSTRSSMRQRNSQTVKTEEKILKLGETLFSCNIYKGDGIYCVRRRRTLSIYVVSSRGIDHVLRVSIAMPVDFRVWTPSWTGTLSLDSIWTGTRSLDSMCDHCLLKNHTISLAFKTFSYIE